jgi:uncharacterized C2H2 Zn-finger protein
MQKWHGIKGISSGRFRPKKTVNRRKTLTITGRKTTSRATGAWCSENVVRKGCTRDQAKRDGERLWKCPESNNDIRDRGLKQKLHSRKRIKDPGDRLPLCPRNEKIFSWTYRRTINSVKIVKEKADLMPHRGKSRIVPCGGVDPLQKGKRNGG